MCVVEPVSTEYFRLQNLPKCQVTSALATFAQVPGHLSSCDGFPQTLAVLPFKEVVAWRDGLSKSRFIDPIWWY